MSVGDITDPKSHPLISCLVTVSCSRQIQRDCARTNGDILLPRPKVQTKTLPSHPRFMHNVNYMDLPFGQKEKRYSLMVIYMDLLTLVVQSDYICFAVVISYGGG